MSSSTSVDTKLGEAVLSTKQTGQLNVVLFCGGRGSASLILEMMRWPKVNLTLMVNGYDDGLSTGRLRDLVPDMLGPSDFRKNLTRILDLHSDTQYALQNIMEYRFSENFSAEDICSFEEFIDNNKSTKSLPKDLDALFSELNPEMRTTVVAYIKLLLRYQKRIGQTLSYSDCSLGNLVFAGAFLEANSDFNASVQKLVSLFQLSCRLINVSKGENRTLMALKADGQLLSRESDVVSAQSRSPIVDFFLLKSGIDEKLKEQLENASIDKKREILTSLDEPVIVSAEADLALRQADLIIYGPGTQFSSLLPSYKTKGVPEAIEESRAAVKVFVANLEEDYDIQGLAVSDLVNTALNVMGDSDGQRNLITHIFVNEPRAGRDRQTPLGEIDQVRFKSAEVVRDSFESVSQSGTHSGYKVTRRAMEVLHNARRKGVSHSVDIYIDLLNRSRALKKVSQEFLDIPWTENFESVRLIVNRLSVSDLNLPEFASAQTTDYRGAFTEVEALAEWLTKGDSEYLVTLAGDGEYRLQDILVGVQILNMSSFGAIYGSRVQNSHQLRSALNMAYGEGNFLRQLSFLGAFVFTMIFALRFRMIMTDPFTGFRIYSRSKFTEALIADLKKVSAVPASVVTILAVRHKLEIAEIPIVYRTFKGFTKPGWRIGRGLKNIGGLFYL